MRRLWRTLEVAAWAAFFALAATVLVLRYAVLPHIERLRPQIVERVSAIVGQRVTPGALDRYLGRIGYDTQQTPALKRHSADNIDGPLPGDRGAHGPFDREARPRSLQLWLRNHRKGLLAAAAALVAVVWIRG